MLGTGVNPGLRDGRAADHADRRLRAGRRDPRRPHPGRAHPPAAVPAEDRRRPDARAVPEEGRRRQRAARRAGRVDLDDCRRAGLEARSRSPTRSSRRSRPRPSRASSSPSIPATSAASSRTASATATGKPVITLHMEAYLGAPESYDAVEITGSPALKMKIAGGVHGDIATASIVVNSMPKILEVAARAAHDARHADAVVLRRRTA